MTLFYTGITLIVLHEMDAIRCKEWRIFPGLSLLSDKVGHLIFMIAHIPIFFFLLWKLTNGSDIGTFRIVFNIFLTAHLVLHLLFLRHKSNEFKDWISWSIIVGAGMCGFLDLILN